MVDLAQWMCGSRDNYHGGSIATRIAEQGFPLCLLCGSRTVWGMAATDLFFRENDAPVHDQFADSARMMCRR